jgi:metal-responsive CopG/Arc/MetJ family transcriptional regulator
MEETRTEKISVNLTPSVLARLDALAGRNRWPRSTAAAVLIEHGLDAQDKMAELSGKAVTRPDIEELIKEYGTEDQEGRS